MRVEVTENKRTLRLVKSGTLFKYRQNEADVYLLATDYLSTNDSRRCVNVENGSVLLVDMNERVEILENVVLRIRH